MRTAEATMAAARADFNVRRGYVRERLRAMGLEPGEAAGGFFVWVPAPGGESGREFAQRLLRETGVLVNPGAPFGPSGDRFVRVSFATDEGRLREGLTRLGRFLAGQPATPQAALATSASAAPSSGTRPAA
jgi:aspartate/methionine/tyrosine aminotransferase